ncbi:MAG: urea transport system substrate-binding protein, partial [Thalassolituus oleivorans]
MTYAYGANSEFFAFVTFCILTVFPFRTHKRQRGYTMRSKTLNPTSGVRRRTLLKSLLAIPAAVMLANANFANADMVNTTGLAVTDDTVTVGILHSVTGTMAISETGSVQAEKLAIKQIN